MRIPPVSCPFSDPAREWKELERSWAWAERSGGGELSALSQPVPKQSARLASAVPLGGKVIHYAVCLGLGGCVGAKDSSSSSGGGGAKDSSSSGGGGAKDSSSGGGGGAKNSSGKRPTEAAGSVGRAGADYGRVLGKMFGPGAGSVRLSLLLAISISVPNVNLGGLIAEKFAYISIQMFAQRA